MLSAVLLAAAVMTSYADSFSDISGYWGCDYVERAFGQKIVNGYPDGSFKPDGKVSHQEAMAMICRTVEAALPGKLDMNRADDFNTVLSALDFNPNWALPYGAALFDAGAAFEEDFTGTASDPAARQTIGVWMARALDLPVPPLCENDIFTDMDTAEARFCGDIYALKRFGIIQGYPDGSFGAGKPVTRGEFAKVCITALDCIAALRESEGKHLLEDSLFLRTGRIEGLDTGKNTISFSWGKDYYVSDDALIIVDGASAGFSELSALAGQELIVSCLQDRSSALIIQTAPLVESGKVKSVEKEGDFYCIGILTGSGHVVDYVLPFGREAEVPGKGSRVSFIAQGAEILEII